MNGARIGDSWKCACGVTVERVENELEEDGLVVELDGVEHSCGAEDDDDF